MSVFVPASGAMRALFCAVLLFAASAATAERVVRVAGGGPAGWEGWTLEGGGWTLRGTARQGDPFPDHPSLRSGEVETGRAVSPEFTVEGDIIRLRVSGWDGRSGERKLNRVVLTLAEDGAEVRELSPPDSDAFVPASWVVSDLRGRRVRIEAIDGLAESGFAWLGIALVEEVAKDVPAGESPFRAVRLQGGPGTWAVLSEDGARRPTTPHLSSLAGGEAGTGIIRSPEFVIAAPVIVLRARGHDGAKCDLGRSFFELVDAASGSILRQSPPPCSDSPVEMVWDVAELEGRRVCIRLRDGNSGSMYAWLGLDSVDAGSSFRVDFAREDASAGWTAESRPGTASEVGGIPFLVSDGGIGRMNGESSIPMGCRARRIFLLGMTDSLDQGCPVWGDPNDTSSRFFVGDRLGTVRVEYSGGAVADYPLILGESLWWGMMFVQFPEPFISSAAAAQALRESLRLFPAAPSPDGRYLAVLEPGPERIERLTLVDSPEKQGVPVICGVTVEVLPGEEPQDGIALPHDRVAGPVLQFVRERALRTSEEVCAQGTKHLDRLREAFYTTDSHFRRRIPVDIPQDYDGPRVRFSGNVWADVLTAVFHHNVRDILAKLDPEDGMYHTSTRDAPSWGGYQGFGTYAEGRGSYHGQCWTRDMGRAMMELTALGYAEKAARTVDYVFRMARGWETGNTPDIDMKGVIRLDLDGARLPRHIQRRFPYFDTTPGEGCFENDGHGLTSLFVYQVWRRLPDRDAWLRERWEDVRGLGDWVIWQFEHPELSGATEVLRTDSECAGGIGYSIYADVACMEALRGLAEMADSIGERESAAAWRAAAARLRRGIDRTYRDAEEPFGAVWTRRHSGWPNQSTVLGPVILPADRAGFTAAARAPEWEPLNLATYRSLIARYRPFGFYGVAMGYGQGFVTQAALLLDRMDDAAKMVEWAARATYCPAHMPFIVPEGCEVEPEGRFWHRTGDLGNGVQQGEIVKMCRVLLGVDDSDPARLRLVPRMPRGFTGMSVRDYPALAQRGGEARTIRLDYSLRREGDGMLLEVRSKSPLPEMDVRLGPFRSRPDSGSGFVDGLPAPVRVEKSGDSWWAWLSVPQGRTRRVIGLR